MIHVREPGVMSVAEESTAWAACPAPSYLGGLGFSLSGHGGGRTTRSRYTSGTRSTAVAPRRASFRMMYVFTEASSSRSHDEVVHGKGRCLPDARRLAGRSSPTCGCCWASSGRARQPPLFMGGESRGERVEPRRAVDRCCSRIPSMAACVAVRDLNDAYRGERRGGSSTSTRTGFSWIDADDADASGAFAGKSSRQRDGGGLRGQHDAGAV